MVTFFELESVPLITYEQAERAGSAPLQWIIERVLADVRRDFESLADQERCFGCQRRLAGLGELPGRVGSSSGRLDHRQRRIAASVASAVTRVFSGSLKRRTSGPGDCPFESARR